LRSGPAVPFDCTAIAWCGPEEHTPQGYADFADRTDCRDHRQDDGWQGCVGSGLVVLADTAAQSRAEEADQITGYRAETFRALGVPVAFLLDHLAPRPDEGLDGPATIREGRSGATHGVCGQSPVGQRREDGAPTEQKSTRDERPAEPE